MRKLLVFNILLFTSQTLFAGSIDKGYEALRIYDYFKAKEIFTKMQRQKTYAIGSFGLATIHYRKDNPFHQLDSAYVHINRAKEGLEKMKPKDQTKYQQYVDNQKIDSLRQLISTSFFQRAIKESTVDGFQQFIDKHSWAIEFEAATFKRDSLIYNQLKLQRILDCQVF